MYISQTFYNLIQKHLIVHYIIPNAITYLFIYFLRPGPDYKLLENILIIPGISYHIKYKSDVTVCQQGIHCTWYVYVQLSLINKIKTIFNNNAVNVYIHSS